jgi:hypothetical protein
MIVGAKTKPQQEEKRITIPSEWSGRGQGLRKAALQPDTESRMAVRIYGWNPFPSSAAV